VYNEYYKLNLSPFTNSIDSRFYFNSTSHAEATLRIRHVIDTMSGLAVMIGDIGTGKSLLARKIIDELEPEKYEASLFIILHSEITAEWLIRKIAFQIGVKEPSDKKVNLIGQIYMRLEEIYNEGRKTVIIIDEANMLQKEEIMEELRGLLNLEVPEQKLISIILIGMPSLEKHLLLDLALHQRISSKFTLSPLTQQNTHDYITHRLRVAGATHEIFPPEVMDAIYMFSQGIPRLINVICDNALLEGFINKKEKIDLEIIKKVTTDLGFQTPADKGADEIFKEEKAEEKKGVEESAV
jgi:type II secretory pathway predicted ATPase ExeA